MPDDARPQKPTPAPHLKELRLLDLAYCLLDLPEGRYKTREQLFNEVPGYREHGYDLTTRQGREAFRATFENDKRNLRGYGFAVITGPANEGYRIDADRTFMGPIEFDDLEAAKLTLVAREMLASETFPLKHDLRIALAKIVGALDWKTAGKDAAPRRPGSYTYAGNDSGNTAASDSQSQPLAEKVANLRLALERRKELSVDYQKPGDTLRPRTIRLYGDYSYKGSWYVVVAGPTGDTDDVRVLRVDRMGEVPRVRAVTPDYQIPEWFSIEDYPKLPFEMGRQNLTGSILIEASVAPFAHSLTLGKGALSLREDGSALWTIRVSDASACAAWCIENGPGLIPIAPVELAAAYEQALSDTLASLDGRTEAQEEAVRG